VGEKNEDIWDRNFAAAPQSSDINTGRLLRAWESLAASGRSL
jgi:hypothetical protein